MKLKTMHTPAHPGEIIKANYIEGAGLSVAKLAEILDVHPSKLRRIVNDSSRVTAEMAMRLSKAFGTSADTWLNMQRNYDIWIASQKVDLSNVRKLKLPRSYPDAED